MHLDLNGDVVGTLIDPVGAVVAASGQQSPAGGGNAIFVFALPQ